MTSHLSPETAHNVGKLLLVDDSTTGRRQLRQAFESAGFGVSEAGEGVEAMWRAREQKFDAVITDIHMPTMDGLEFLAELRKLPAYENVPVYILTSDCSRERMTEGKKLGATGWIVKPPAVSTLVELVRSQVGARAAELETAR